MGTGDYLPLPIGLLELKNLKEFCCIEKYIETVLMNYMILCIQIGENIEEDALGLRSYNKYN